MFLKDYATKLAKEHANDDDGERARRRERRAEEEKMKALRAAAETSARSARARERALDRSNKEEHNARARGEVTVSYDDELIASCTRAAIERGIRGRRDDKAQLPTRARDVLGVERSGRAFFKLTRVSDERKMTHVGVLDYGCVRDGAIGLPIKVMRQLGAGSDGTFLDGEDGRVRATYVTLPLGTKMTLKPKKNDFARDFMGGESAVDVREILERVMLARSCATVGDEIVVEENGKEYELVVTAVEPISSDGEDEDANDGSNETRRRAAVSLLETDVEVELEPSAEYDDVARRERRRREEFEAAKAKLAEREEQKALEIASRHANFVALKASIKPESSDGAVVKLRFSLPNGTLTTRRFASDGSRTLRDVFDYVRSMDDDLFDADFELITRDGLALALTDASVDPSTRSDTYFVKRRR